ncbi:hypothetical protein BaRGS_00025895 [Batillaria attramentaria]|uniref:Uncharacterized protein n=1 Tax=Batillaria attramentaria TaxID=370345 RepID=A0ABD0K6X8_9CAEN
MDIFSALGLPLTAKKSINSSAIQQQAMPTINGYPWESTASSIEERLTSRNFSSLRDDDKTRRINHPNGQQFVWTFGDRQLSSAQLLSHLPLPTKLLMHNAWAVLESGPIRISRLLAKSRVG